jgi:hypothetical protein
MPDASLGIDGQLPVLGVEFRYSALELRFRYLALRAWDFPDLALGGGKKISCVGAGGGGCHEDHFQILLVTLNIQYTKIKFSPVKRPAK